MKGREGELTISDSLLRTTPHCTALPLHPNNNTTTAKKRKTPTPTAQKAPPPSAAEAAAATSTDKVTCKTR